MKENNYLSYEEEKILGLKAQQGDQEAFNRVFEANLKFAYQLAYKYIGLVKYSSNCDYDDLKQAAAIGLTEAIKRCDFTRETTFRTFATHWIKKYVFIEGLVSQGTAKIPTQILLKSLKYRRLTSKVDDEKIPTDEEFLKILDTNPKELEKIKLANEHILKRANYYETYLEDDLGMIKVTPTFALDEEGLGKDPEVGYFEDKYEYRFDFEYFNILSDFEKELLIAKFNLDNPNSKKEVSIADLAKKYNMPYNTIRYKLQRALEKLKKHFEKKGLSLDDFLVNIENR